MTDRPDILIQNVSAQCIPNLVAMRTFKPKHVLWVYTPEFGDVRKRLHDMVSLGVGQSDCCVDARNVETLHQCMWSLFENLPQGATVIYHATGGTKSMALVGLGGLGVYHRTKSEHVQCVVMDPRSQHFDVVYPQARNEAYSCAGLSFEDIIQVHGNGVHKPGRSLPFLGERSDALEEIRRLAPKVRNACMSRQVGKNEDGWVPLLQGKSIPGPARKALGLLQDAGFVQRVTIDGNRVRCISPVFDCDPFAYIRNVWMEDWAGAVLGQGLSDWQGAYSGVKVRFGKATRMGVDTQEFDFLGARCNRLVYWSCKNIKQVLSQTLFEVDALRDEVAGQDFHIAGLLYSSDEFKAGLQHKARRLGLHVVDVFAEDAAEQIIRASGG